MCLLNKQATVIFQALFLFHPIPSDHQSLSGSIRAASYRRITISQSPCGSPHRRRANQSTARLALLRWNDRLALFSSQLPPVKAAEEGMTMDADECHSGLNLAGRRWWGGGGGGPPRAGSKTIGSSNGYLYELPFSDQLFVIKRGYCWNGLFTYDVVVCIRLCWKAAVCVCDAHMYVNAHVNTSVFLLIS